MEACLPSFETAVATLRTLVDEGNPTVELEVRFGYLSSTFECNMHPLYFKDFVQCFDACKDWTAVDADWQELVDTSYKLPDGTLVRTTCQALGRPPAHIHKERKHSEVMCSMGMPCTAQSGMDLRVAVAVEHAVQPPEWVLPTFVRIKQRRSFTFRHWRWDLTRVWQGASLLHVDKQVRDSAPRYEVELELLNPGAYLAAHSNQYIARSLAMKLWDVIRRVAKDKLLTYQPKAITATPKAPREALSKVNLPRNLPTSQTLSVLEMDGTVSSYVMLLQVLQKGHMPLALVADVRKAPLIQDFLNHCRTTQGHDLPDVVVSDMSLLALLADVQCKHPNARDAADAVQRLNEMDAMEELNRYGRGAQSTIFWLPEDMESAWQYIWPCNCDEDTQTMRATDMVELCENCEFCLPLIQKFRAMFAATPCVPKTKCLLTSSS